MFLFSTISKQFCIIQIKKYIRVPSEIYSVRTKMLYFHFVFCMNTTLHLDIYININNIIDYVIPVQSDRFILITFFCHLNDRRGKRKQRGWTRTKRTLTLRQWYWRTRCNGKLLYDAISWILFGILFSRRLLHYNTETGFERNWY